MPNFKLMYLKTKIKQLYSIWKSENLIKFVNNYIMLGPYSTPGTRQVTLTHMTIMNAFHFINKTSFRIVKTERRTFLTIQIGEVQFEIDNYDCFINIRYSKLKS